MSNEQTTDAKLAIAQACLEFRKLWENGSLPRVNEFIASLGSAIQPLAIKKIVAIDLELRHKHRLPVSKSNYEELPPEFLELVKPDIEQLWSTIHIDNEDQESSKILEPSDDFHTYLDKIATVPPPAHEPVRFKIRHMHARGGLGEVFVATDEELGRRVALKQIQDELADDPIARERFELEAHVTGSLEHPGIVPVYGFGKYADGRPFYAMRFIRGRSMKEAIKKFFSDSKNTGHARFREFEFRELLNRLIDSCQAIAFAHSRGVLHRDIKPSNIMLGKYGETLVVDWGLAKTIDRQDDLMSFDTSMTPLVCDSHGSATSQGSTIGTPAFMSPEQAMGLLDNMTTLSDVYSLGATLYMLLTGQPAFDGKNAREIVEKVKTGDFRSPLDVEPSVPKPLNAICLKAMSLKPEDRYANTLELADEINRFLADQPVSAYRDSPFAKVGRWVRVHRTVAMSLGLGLIGIAITASIAAVLLNTEKNETLRQKAKVDVALRFETEAKSLTHEMLSSSSELVLSLYERTPQLIQKEPELLEALINQYKDFAVTTNLKLADQGAVYLQIASFQRHLGQHEATQSSCAQAISSFELALEEFPEATILRKGLAKAFSLRALAFQDTNQFSPALDNYRKAGGKWKELSTINPDDFDIQMELVAISVNTGNNYLQEGGEHVDTARDFYRAAKILLDTIKAKSTIRTVRQNRQLEKLQIDGMLKIVDIQLLSNLGSAQQNQGKLDDAIDGFEKSRDRYAEFLNKYDRPQVRCFANVNAKNLGECYLAKSREKNPNDLAIVDAAIDVLRDALADQDKLVKEWPSRRRYKYRLAQIQLSLGKAYGKNDIRAEEHLDEAERLFEDLSNQDDKYWPEYVSTLRNLGIYYQSRDEVLSKSYMEDAKTIQVEKIKFVEGNLTQLEQFIAVDLSWIKAVQTKKEPETVVAFYRDIIKRLDNSEVFNKKQYSLWLARTRLATFLTKQKAWGDAAKVWKDVLEDPDIRNRNIIESYWAICLIRAGNIGEGMKAIGVLLDPNDIQPNDRHNAACAYAIAAEVIEQGIQINGEMSEEQQNADWHRQQAMRVLVDSAKAGLFEHTEQRTQVSTDADLNSLRGMEEFKDFCKKHNIPIVDRE